MRYYGVKDMAEFKTEGVCARAIRCDIREGRLYNVVFEGGCKGNLKGIGALVEGMEVSEVIKRLSGIRCGERSTSCPDQLACALKNSVEL